MSTAQLIVTLALVGLLGALHLVRRAARAPAGAGPVAAPRPVGRRISITTVLVAGAVAALAFVSIAFIVSILDEDDDVTAPTTQATTTQTQPTTTPPMPPPPPEPPPPVPLEPPAGTALVARVITNDAASITSSRNQVGKVPTVARRETGVYAVTVPGLSPELRRRSAIRAQPADGAGVQVSARKVGPQADFFVFTRNTQTGSFANGGFELAVFLPKGDLERTAGEQEPKRPKLPGTR